LALRQANVLPFYTLALAGTLAGLVVGLLAGTLAARANHPLLGALVWLAAAAVLLFVTGHLPYEGASWLAGLADRRFWGLPIYPFDDGAQGRLVVGSLLPALVLTGLGVAQDTRVEGLHGALERGRLSPHAWMLLLLPLPLVAAAGLAADNVILRPLREPLGQVAEIIQQTRDFSGDLDVLSRQTGLNDAAVGDVRGELGGPYHLMLGELGLDDQTMVVVASFDSGAWLNCRTLVDRISFCADALPAYAQGLTLLLAGHDVAQCRDCQMQAADPWPAWLAQRGPRLGPQPQIARLGQAGSYVLIRAAGPAASIECLFQGNRVINLEWCRDA
jgi:hypothetical protein